jgi:hypothetical protein
MARKLRGRVYVPGKIQNRLDFSSVAVLASQTDGGIMKAGDGTTKLQKDTADMKFMSFYFENDATSGDNRGMYLRLYLGGGAGGEALRVFTTVEDVTAGTAHGAHVSLSFGTSGKLTGQGIATRSTLHLPSTALPASNVTYSALQAEIYSDAATSDPAGNKLSAVRVVNGGNATGMADVDDDAALFELSGWTAGAGNMVGANYVTSTAIAFENWVPIRVRIGDTDHYIVAAQAVTNTA